MARTTPGAAERFDLSSLNPSQRQAVLHEAGPLLVLAGAGSGKTRVITYRVGRLLRDGVDGARILGMTFTNKAAREMRERLQALVGKRAAAVQLCTFHALGLSILKEDYALAGLRRSFCIYDTSDQLGLVRELMRHTKVADRRLDAWRVLETILKAKRERRQKVAIEYGDDYEFAAYDLYPKYVEQMAAFNAVDFDDLILKAQDVLRHAQGRARWAERFDHVVVDEYQDTSPDQFELIRVLTERHCNICVVGDDDQSIYAWRGAQADNILKFNRQFAGATEIVLDQNYRSTESILNAANALIANNTQRKVKNLWSTHGTGEPVEVVACTDGEDEAAFVAETIQGLLYGGASAEDIAVLYRANAQSQIFEETLSAERIPFRVVGGQSFFDRKEVRDAVAYLALLHNAYDEISLRRVINVPPRGVGAGTLEKLTAFAEGHKTSLWAALRRVDEVEGVPARAVPGIRELVELLETTRRQVEGARGGLLTERVRQLFEALRLKDAILDADDSPAIAQRRLENVEEVLHVLGRFEQHARPGASPLEEFLQGSALARPESAGAEEPEDAESRSEVTLMTLHSAKGLEFPYVFIVGVEEDCLPHRRTVDMDGDIAEERRLAYVGITRARRGLWLTYARRRSRYGQLVERTPSRFLQELPEDQSVRRRGREVQSSPERAEALADDFFKRMRSQLGIED